MKIKQVRSSCLRVSVLFLLFIPVFHLNPSHLLSLLNPIPNSIAFLCNSAFFLLLAAFSTCICGSFFFPFFHSSLHLQVLSLYHPLSSCFSSNPCVLHTQPHQLKNHAFPYLKWLKRWSETKITLKLKTLGILQRIQHMQWWDTKFLERNHRHFCGRNFLQTSYDYICEDLSNSSIHGVDLCSFSSEEHESLL